MFRRREKPRVVHFGDCKLVYRELGSGPPLLLVHGLAGSSGWWRHNVPVFSKHFTVYLLDLVGYGSNRALRPMSIANAANCLGEFIGQLPAGKAHVIGHSMGGQICTHLAAEHPERVERLVLASASGMVRSDLLRMMLRLPSTSRYGRLNFIPTLAYDSLRSGPLNLLLSALDILSNDVTDALAKIVAPTLLIWGEQDKLVPVEVGQGVHQALQSAWLEVIPNAGHVVMWDQAEAFNRLVLDFLLSPRPERPAPPTAAEINEPPARPPAPDPGP